MENEELMTIGELAKRMRVTVRTLQYYDREGLLKPSGHSEGGRRLYTNKDAVQLHQILSMKYLGFSLNDIKSNIISINTPEEAKELLNKQAEAIKEDISNLSEALNAIQILITEISDMNEVDFTKYAKIIELIREKDDDYSLIKYWDHKTLDHIEAKFTRDSGKEFMEKIQNLCERVNELNAHGEKPEGVKGQALAKEWWNVMQEFSGGNMEIISELMSLYKNNDSWRNELKDRNMVVDKFIEKALFVYLQNEEKNGGQNE